MAVCLVFWGGGGGRGSLKGCDRQRLGKGTGKRGIEWSSVEFFSGVSIAFWTCMDSWPLQPP